MVVDRENPQGAWSRRRFVANGLLPAIFLPVLPRALVETGPPRSSIRQRRRTAAAGGGHSRPSAGEFAARLTATVFINGQGPYRFLVDTGAQRSVLAAELAARLRLPHGPPVLVEGIIRAQRAQEVRIKRLATGSLVCSDLRVPTLPGAELRADGYLGLDVLDGHRVVFDFGSHRVMIEKPQGFFAALWTGREQIRVGMRGDAGRLRFTHCYVDGVRATAFIDSGAEVSVCNSALFAALRHVRNPPQTLEHVRLSGVTGGTMLGVVTLIEAIRIPGLTFTRTPVVIADLRVFDLWGLSVEPALLIGMNCLRAFSSVSIDYGRKDLLLRIPTARNRPINLAQTDSRLA